MADAPFQPDWFSKPGDTLLTLMEHRELTCDALAKKLGRSEATVRGLLAGSVEIDDALAQGLADCVAGTAAFWRSRQSSYSASLARAASAIPQETSSAWLRQFPHRDILNQGWIAKPNKPDDLLQAYLAYFGVVDPIEWAERYAKSLKVAFRTSPSFKSKSGSLSAWLRRGELEAASMLTARWSPQLLRERIQEMRVLTKAKTPAYFLPRLRKIFADAGVALVFIRAPSGCHASGATRFLTSNKAMIVLSFRYLSDDHFWFTLFHELGHLPLHGSATTFIDGKDNNLTQQEREANEFSAAALIPPARRDELFDLKPRKENVIRFAFSVGVSAGIVVGQLQHHRVIKQNQLNFLKRRFDWEQIAHAVS